MTQLSWLPTLAGFASWFKRFLRREKFKNCNKKNLKAAAVSLSQERRRRRILVGFDIYCTAATCGWLRSVKTGGNSGGFSIGVRSVTPPTTT